MADAPDAAGPVPDVLESGPSRFGGTGRWRRPWVLLLVLAAGAALIGLRASEAGGRGDSPPAASAAASEPDRSVVPPPAPPIEQPACTDNCRPGRFRLDARTGFGPPGLRLVTSGNQPVLLDVGTGRGWPALYLAQRSGCSVVGTDLPLAALNKARRRAVVRTPMRKRTLSENARVLAGVFLLLATPFSARAVERLTIAAEQKDGGCPVGPPLGIVQIPSSRELPTSLEKCVVLFEIGDLAESSVQRDAARLAKTAGAAAIVLDFTRFSQTPDDSVRTRLPFAIKQLSSAVRAASPNARIGLDFSSGPGEPFSLDLEEGLGAYFDAIAAFAGRVPPAFSEEGKERWLFLLRTPGRTAAGEVVQAVLAGETVPQIVGIFSTPERTVDDSDWQELGRLQRYWTDDVSRDPTATTATRPDGSRFSVLRFFDAKKFTPILVLAEDPAGRGALGALARQAVV